MAKTALTVLQLLPALESGGVERGTLEVGAALVRAGHRSLVMSAGGRLVRRLEEQGSEHLTWPIGQKSLWTLRLVPRLRRLLQREGVDILHARSRLPAWIAWLAWRGMDPASRPRWVTTVHGLYSVKRYSAIMTRGERVIAVSDQVRRYILDNYPDAEPDRICVIPRGVDRVAYPYGYQPGVVWLRAWYNSYPQLEGKFVITLPGRLTRLKGHLDLIELLSRLRARGIMDVHALIVGGEDPRRQTYADTVRRQAEEAGLDNLTFTGHRSDLREIMAVSDAVLSVSSQPESFGRTVLEALSLGVPVLGYAHGGVADQLDAIFPQGAVSPGDIEAATQKLTEWIQSPPWVPERHPYTLQNMLDQTLALYQELAQAPRGS